MYATADTKSEADYKAESDCRTLIEAQKIMKDKPRYDAAMKVAKKQHEDLMSIAGNHAMSNMKPDTDKDGN